MRNTLEIHIYYAEPLGQWSYLGIEGNTVLSVFCNGILLGDRRKGRQYSVLGDTLGHKTVVY